MSRTDTVPADQALGLLPRAARVVCSPGCGTPLSLLRALAARAPDLDRPHLYSGLLLGGYPFLDELAAGQLDYTTWLAMPPARPALAAGQAAYLPARGSDVPAVIRSLRPDVALARVTPPDRSGYVSVGPAAGYTAAMLEAARLCIGEVDEALPRTHGRSLVHVSAFAALVETDTATPEYHAAPPSDRSRRIAEYALELVPHDAVLQLGIGEVPEALVWSLQDTDRGRLRFAGMATDGIAALMQSGRVPASPVPEPSILAVELMGTRALLDFARDNPSVGMYPADAECHPRGLGRLPRFVSINSALEVDLSGQVSAEAVGARVVAGIGGSADFNEAAGLSDGGLRIVALPSTTPPRGDRAGRSRIVARLTEGSPVTLPRSRIDYVVTEFGVARLWGRSLAERAEALLSVAHPDHRDALAGAPAAARGGTEPKEDQ